MFWDLSEDASAKLPPVSPDQPQGAGSHKEGRVSHVKEGRVSHIEPHFIMVFHIISVPLLVINHYKPMILTYIIVPKTDQCLKFQIIKKKHGFIAMLPFPCLGETGGLYVCLILSHDFSLISNVFSVSFGAYSHPFWVSPPKRFSNFNFL
jgi:hypothetical protein